MSNPQIHRQNRAFAASEVLEAVGDCIGRIKHQRALTYGDIGAAFGKSEDVAANYRAGLSDMPMTAFLRGIVALGKDFGNVAMAFADLKLVDIDDVCTTPDMGKLAPLGRAVAMVAECTAHDSDGGAVISRQERLANAQEIRDLMLVAKELNDALDVDLLAVGPRS